MIYRSGFQHPETGCSVEATYSFGQIRFEVELGEEESAATAASVGKAIGCAHVFGEEGVYRKRVSTLAVAEEILQLVAGDQYEGFES